MATDQPGDPFSQENPGYPQQPPASWAPTPNPAQGGFNVANPGVQYPRQSMATLALILSLLSFVGLCCITAPIGTVLGYVELKAIDRGETDPSNRGVAQAAVVAGAVAIGLVVLAFVGIVLLLTLGTLV